MSKIRLTYFCDGNEVNIVRFFNDIEGLFLAFRIFYYACGYVNSFIITDKDNTNRSFLIEPPPYIDYDYDEFEDCDDHENRHIIQIDTVKIVRSFGEESELTATSFWDVFIKEAKTRYNYNGMYSELTR